MGERLTAEELAELDAERTLRERQAMMKALQDIAGSRPTTSEGRLHRARARQALDELGIVYRQAP